MIIEKLIKRSSEGNIYHAIGSKNEYAIKKIDIKNKSLSEIDSLFEKVNFWLTIKHSHIVKIYNVKANAMNIELHLEHCKFGNLNKKIKFLDKKFVLLQLTNICDSLTKIHEKNFIHGDLSLDNILIDDKFNFKLTDFGSILKIDESLSKLKYFSSTVKYLAPERALFIDFDHRSDLFSLSAMIYEILTNEVLFKSHIESAMYDSSRHINLLKRIEKIDDKFTPFFMKGLNPIYQERFSSANEMKKSLLHIINL